MVACRLIRGASSTAKYQRPVEWDGQGWATDKDRLQNCLENPSNSSDSSVHDYNVESVLQSDLAAPVLKSGGMHRGSTLSFSQMGHTY